MKAQVNDNMKAPSETILPRCDVIPDIPPILFPTCELGDAIIV